MPEPGVLSAMAWFQQSSRIRLGVRTEALREHTIAVGVDRFLDRWFLLFRLFVVRPLENVAG